MKNQLIIGIHPLLEAVNEGIEIDKVLLKNGMNTDTLGQLLPKLKQRQIPFQFVPIEKLNRISGKNHQGIIAFSSLISYQSITNSIPKLYEDGVDPLVLILDQISDVRNFGAIIRTASCSGIHAVVISEKGSAQINEDTVKASAGAIFKVDICRESELGKCVNFLKESGLKIIACSEKASQYIYEVDFTSPAAIIIGSEGEGISSAIIKLADHIVKIPVLGGVQSLNASVAAGVVCYEAVRQRKSFK